MSTPVDVRPRWRLRDASRSNPLLRAWVGKPMNVSWLRTRRSASPYVVRFLREYGSLVPDPVWIQGSVHRARSFRSGGSLRDLFPPPLHDLAGATCCTAGELRGSNDPRDEGGARRGKSRQATPAEPRRSLDAGAGRGSAQRVPVPVALGSSNSSQPYAPHRVDPRYRVEADNRWARSLRTALGGRPAEV